jgi:anti-sigma28 factor (negative regulator of flagellin synthesis)
MDIKRIASAYGAQAYESTAKNSKKQAPDKSAATVPKEQVEFSETSQSMSKLIDAVNAEPDIRIPMVEEIRQKIKLNGYPIETKIYKALEKMMAENIV